MPFSLVTVQLGQGFRHIVAHGSAIVPKELVLHVADALALNRVRDDAAWAAGFEWHLRDGLLHSAHIVAIEFANGPAKGAPFVGKGIQVDYFSDCAEALNLVVVDEDDEIVELVMRREEGRFPHRTFVAFPIADQAKDAAGAAVALGGKSHARSDRKSMAEGASGKLDARNILVHDVTSQG